MTGESPAEHGARLASLAPPLTEAQVEAAARILATVEPEFRYTTADLAAELGIHKNTLRKRAAGLGIGINLEGRAGYRYSERDRAKLIDSLRPPAPIPLRRRRR